MGACPLILLLAGNYHSTSGRQEAARISLQEYRKMRLVSGVYFNHSRGEIQLLASVVDTTERELLDGVMGKIRHNLVKDDLFLSLRREGIHISRVVAYDAKTGERLIER